MDILLKDKNGVTLNTANKYCTEDINVNIDSKKITITPTVEEQTRDGLFNEVVVSGEPNLNPENIKMGVKMFDVEGSFTSDATATAENLLEGTTAYVNGEKIEGNIPTNGVLEFEPSDEEQTIPTGYTSGGSVLPADITKLDEYDKCLTIINSIEDMSEYSDTTATPEDIREGKTAYSNGERIVGAMEVSNHNATFSTNNITVFRVRDALHEIDFTEIDISNIVSFNSAFNGCAKLVRVNGEIDCSKVRNIGSMFYGCTLLKEFNIKNTNSVTDMSGMYHNCSSLVDIPMLNTKSLVNNQYAGPLQNTFYNCTSLSDESLNNVLAMCTNATNITYHKTLKYVGLTQAQATKCQSLSNWQAFVDAGWKTGY